METEGGVDAKSKRNCCCSLIWREPSVTSSTMGRDIKFSDEEDGSIWISRRHSPTIHHARLYLNRLRFIRRFGPLLYGLIYAFDR